MQIRTGKILKENLVKSPFHQTLGDEFTFQHDNNLKHKAKSTLELLTKKTVNVPEWLSYSFDLNLSENGFLAMTNNQFDRAWRTLKRIMINVAQFRCGKLLRTYPERLTAVITAKCHTLICFTCLCACLHPPPGVSHLPSLSPVYLYLCSLFVY